MIGVGSLAFLLLLSGPLLAEGQQCSDPLFSVEGRNNDTIQRTCNSASKARQKLASCGVIVDSPILIELKEAFAGELSECLGVYHCGEGKIEILTPESLSIKRDKGGAFELISDEAYWDSVLTHELTHAVYDKVVCPFSACLATSEYAGYVMQVFALPEDQRALFGQTVEIKSAVSSESVSAIMYFFAPDLFAKNAWLHFQSRPDSCSYMRQIMQGDIFFDRERF